MTVNFRPKMCPQCEASNESLTICLRAMMCWIHKPVVAQIYKRNKTYCAITHHKINKKRTSDNCMYFVKEKP